MIEAAGIVDAPKGVVTEVLKDAGLNREPCVLPADR